MPEIPAEFYLTPADVVNGTVITILDAGVVEDTEFQGKKRKTLKLQVEHRSQKMFWRPNARTQRALAASWGKQTEAWVGKKVVLDVVKMDISGVIKDVIHGRPAGV